MRRTDTQANIEEMLTAADLMGTDPELAEAPLRLGTRLADFLQSVRHTLRDFEQVFEHQQRLREVTSRANAGLLLDDILEHVYEAFRPLIPYERIGLALLEDEGRVLRARWARTEARQIRLKRGHAAPMAGSSLQTIIETGRPRVLNDLEAYLVEHPSSASTRRIVEEGLRSSLTCPLVALDRPVGFLFFSSSQANTYADAHADVFMQIAQQISLIVEKARLYEALQQANERLAAEILQRERTEAALRQTQDELEEANRELARQAATDGLTGVANRRAFDDLLGREWRRSLRKGEPVALVMIDVDSFKAYNDTHGHLAGDDCLRAVASVLKQAVRRPSDLVARYGGEEFAALLPDTDGAGAGMLAERMREGVEARRLPHGHSGVSPDVTISVGVASRFPQAGDDPAALIADADHALYRAKAGGRNRVIKNDDGHGRDTPA